MRKHLLTTGLLLTVLALLVLVGRHAAADAPNVNAMPSPDLRVNSRIYDQIESDLPSDKVSEWRTKIAAGPNSNATVTIDLITDGGAGNQIDDGVTSGTVSGQGTKIAVEVFARGVTTSLVGVKIDFDFKAEELKLDKVENSAFLFAIPEPTGVNFAATAPVTLLASGFIGRAEFSTVADVTGQEFTLGIKQVTLAESAASSDVITTTDTISFNAMISPDFDGDGTVGFSDFLAFAGRYGARQGGGQYEARYDLDSDGAISFSDFLIFANNYGQQVPPSGDGGGGSTGIVDIPDANLRAAIETTLGKASGASITRADMLTLTQLDAPNKGIRNLTGLEHAINLQWLGLGRVRVNDELVNSNAISNLSPLSNLTNLTYLNLTSNSISDISALSNLTNLTGLVLGDNSISDISTLSNLTNLTWLDLWDNSISDISTLSNLTNLTGLGLGDNSISDISTLSNLTNLTWLDLWDNSISDISALSNLTNLTELYLYNNSISDISALSNLTNLTWLHLASNSISDISALSNLTNLERLYLASNSISDISPLVANTGLGSGDTVDLRSNPLSSTSIYTHIPALQRRGVTVVFDSSSTGIVDIPDANLRAAIETTLGKASGASITRADMLTLTQLDAPNKGIRNLTGLEHAINLQWLGLGRVRVNDELVNSNDISNLSPLSNLTNLTRLHLASNSISDISALSNLTNLTRLHLYNNSISDISALSNLTNLTWLHLGTTVSLIYQHCPT